MVKKADSILQDYKIIMLHGRGSFAAVQILNEGFFRSSTLEVLRQSIEDKVVTISRAQGSLTFPANFQLAAAMNPCPCGYYGDPQRPYTCSNMIVTKYQKRISGPLLDWKAPVSWGVDIHIDAPRAEYEKLSEAQAGESSAVIRARVEAACQIQRERFSNL
jgi:magnesium chelatase family protein